MVRGRAIGVACVFIAGCNAVLGIGDDAYLVKQDAGTGCLLTSDCPSGQACVFERCSKPCNADVDCPRQERCLSLGSEEAACVAHADSSCTEDGDCPESSVCAEGSCRNECSSDKGCLGGQRCSGGVCVGSDPTRDPGVGDSGAPMGGRDSGIPDVFVPPLDARPDASPDAMLPPVDGGMDGGNGSISAGADAGSDADAGGDAGCTTGTGRCVGKVYGLCDASHDWVETACPALCDQSAGCITNCTAGTSQCSATTDLQTCVSGTWQTTTCDHECMDVGGDAQCVQCTNGDELCPQGCVYPTDTDCPRGAGESCAAAAQCAGSLTCGGEGVCCDSACSDPCKSCLVAGKLGTCTPLDFSGSSDAQNCGACGRVCSPNNVMSSCSAGACNGACTGGFLDCDGDKQSNGCEIDSQNDPDHCGGCTGKVCSSNNVTSRGCTNGACTATCAAGRRDCNSDLLTDGCETNITNDPDNCGACKKVCSSSHVVARTCGGRSCNGTCVSGYDDCDGNKQTNGCETHVANDPDNCGACKRVCSSSHMATRTCGGSACNGTCVSGYDDCDSNKQVNGCETHTNTDPNHCGGCGTACKYRSCQAGSCVASTWGDPSVTPGPTTTKLSKDTLWAMKINIVPAGVSSTLLQALGIVVVVDGLNPSANIRLGLYSDSGGNAPAALEAQTAPFVTSNGVDEQLLSTPVSISTGSHWVAFVADQDLRVHVNTGTITWVAASKTFGSLPASFPAPSPYTVERGHLYAVTTP